MTRPINKHLVLIRWMGSRLAVHEPWLPSESGQSVRKNLGTVCRNRRGRRSRRGGRKRRALTSAAPEHPPPPPPKGYVSDRILYRRMRTFDYSRRIIDSIKSCGKVVARCREALNRDHRNQRYIDQYNVNRQRFLSLCKQWRTLRAATHGEPTFAIEYAFALEVGDDIPFRGSIAKVRSLVPYFAPAKEEIVQAIPISASGNASKDTKKTYWCTKCARSTTIRICRLCGGELAPLVRSSNGKSRGKFNRKVTIHRSPSHDSSPEREERAPPGVFHLGWK